MSRVFKSHELAVTAPRRLSLVLPSHDYDDQNATFPEQKAEDVALELVAASRIEAESILQAARLDAERVLAEAREQAKILQEAGYEAGRQQGYRDGWQDAQQKTEEELREAQSLCHRLRLKDKELLEQSQKEVLQLALAVSERVIGLKLSSEDAAVQAALRQVLKAAQGAREGLLRVSAKDFLHIWDRRQEWRSLLPGLHDLKIEHDPALQPGDLIFMTNHGTIDARVAVVQEEVAAQLLPDGAGNGLEG